MVSVQPPTNNNQRRQGDGSLSFIIYDFQYFARRSTYPLRCSEKTQGDSVQDKHAVTLSCIRKANATGPGRIPLPFYI